VGTIIINWILRSRLKSIFNPSFGKYSFTISYAVLEIKKAEAGPIPCGYIHGR
jgi:hypothetical protein